MANVFDWDTIFIRVLSWFTFWSLSWNTYLTVTLGGTDGGFAFLNISARVLNASVCTFPILNSGLAGAGFCIEQIKPCAALNVASVEDICGMLNCFGENSTVSHILSALVLGMYALWYL